MPYSVVQVMSWVLGSPGNATAKKSVRLVYVVHSCEKEGHETSSINAAALSQIRRMTYPPKPAYVALILPEKEILRTKFPWSEIVRRGRVIAIPIDNLSIFGFQESQKTTIGPIPKVMASDFNGVARFDSIGSHSYSLEARAAGCFQSPHLCLAFGIFDLHVDPRMGHKQVHFCHHALDVHECVFVVAMGMVRPCRQSKDGCTNHCDTDN